ncbi:MAG: four helix bundle protein [Candidatus Woesearchaeota archaeon]|nr:MAG: four helix bundle protein [Candidatus Woesearchaeota archaeon]
MARDFKTLEIWQKSYALALALYQTTEKFPSHELNNLTSQMRRAAISIPLNIAEGCSRQTKRSFMQFLSYSYGSIKELQVLIRFAKDLKYIKLDEFVRLNNELDGLGMMTFKFMTKVENDVWLSWFKK